MQHLHRRGKGPVIGAIGAQVHANTLIDGLVLENALRAGRSAEILQLAASPQLRGHGVDGDVAADAGVWAVALVNVEVGWAVEADFFGVGEDGRVVA